MSEFCDYEKNRRRCVLRVNHLGFHDLQPFTSEVVRSILRQEETDLRLMRRSEDPKQLTVPVLLSALDEAVVRPSVTSKDDTAIVTSAPISADSKST